MAKIASDLTCPVCATTLEKGHLYVRGIFASLHWSTRGDTRVLSRKNLEQIDLSRISSTPAGGQAVINAWLCPACNLLSFRQR